MRLIIIALFSIAILKATSFGWRFLSKSIPEFSQQNIRLPKELKLHVYKLAGEIGDRSTFNYTKLNYAANYISDKLESFGYNVEFQGYSVWGKTVKNIIATKRGIDKPAEFIIVGTHYDTCFNPGADDNASAVAGLLELANFFSNKRTNRSIRFIAFVNEEPPFFKTQDMGSVVFVKEAKAKKEDIKAVFILEMIGYYKNTPNSQRYPLFYGPFYPNKGNFIALVGNLHSRELLKQTTSAFKSHSQFPVESLISFGLIPGADFSDHWAFWKANFPALMVTDTAFYRNPYYHSNSDTYEKLDYKSMAEVVRGLTGVLIEATK